MKMRNEYQSKRKLWGLLTFKFNPNEQNSEELKSEEIFDLEIQIFKLRQSMLAVVTINKKKKLMKKLKSLERKLFDLKNYV